MQTHSRRNELGFSLFELLIAMSITLVIMGLASTLLASSFNMRSRQDRKSDAIADVQRALNSMSREIGSSGYKLPGGLPSVSSNGIVAGDSDSQSVRIVSNLNGADGTDTDVNDVDEDVKFLMYVDNTLGQRYLVRYEKNATNTTTVLANRVDSLVIRYYDEKVTYNTTLLTGVGGQTVADLTNVRNSAGNLKSEVSPADAKYVVIAVGVVLPTIGTPGSPGYQAQSEVELTSDVTLRNSITY